MAKSKTTDTTDQTVVDETVTTTATETVAETTAEAADTTTVTDPEPALETQPDPTPTETPAPAIEPEAPKVEVVKSGPKGRNNQKSAAVGKTLRKKATVFSTDAVTAVKDEAPLITFEELVRRKYGTDLNNLGAELTGIMSFLDRYQNVMGQYDVVEETGMSLQRQLYRTYLKILSLADVAERNVAMEYLLWKFFDKTSNAFTPVPLARFTRRGNWDISELLMFNSLNSIFDKIKDPATRFAQLSSLRIGEIVQRYPADKIIFTDGLINWTQSMR